MGAAAAAAAQRYAEGCLRVAVGAGTRQGRTDTCTPHNTLSCFTQDTQTHTEACFLKAPNAQLCSV